MNLTEAVKARYDRYNVLGDENCFNIHFQDVFGNAASAIRSNFNLTMNHEICFTWYETVFAAIIKFLKSKQALSKAYEIKLGTFSIGYINETMEDDEKVGNITVTMNQIGNGMIKEGEMENDPIIAAKVFNERNAISADIGEISNFALITFREEFGIDLTASTLIIPIFASIHYHLIAALQLLLSTSDFGEVKIDIFGLYTVTLCKDKNNVFVYYHVDDNIKHKLKDDKIAAIEE
jgi:hypothetical protein